MFAAAESALAQSPAATALAAAWDREHASAPVSALVDHAEGNAQAAAALRRLVLGS